MMKVDRIFEVQKTEMEVLVQQALEVRGMVTIEQMQGHFDRMKEEVADWAAQSLKEHFVRHPQDILSEPVMMKIMGLLKRQCDGHHMELGEKNGPFCH